MSLMDLDFVVCLYVCIGCGSYENKTYDLNIKASVHLFFFLIPTLNILQESSLFVIVLILEVTLLKDIMYLTTGLLQVQKRISFDICYSESS
jgi:hypothetical protein